MTKDEQRRTSKREPNPCPGKLHDNDMQGQRKYRKDRRREQRGRRRST